MDGARKLLDGQFGIHRYSRFGDEFGGVSANSVRTEKLSRSLVGNPFEETISLSHGQSFAQTDESVFEYTSVLQVNLFAHAYQKLKVNHRFFHGHDNQT